MSDALRLPPLPHPKAPDDSRRGAYQVLVYDAHVFALGGGSQRTVEQRFTIGGDTLTLVELQGSDTLSVAFGDQGKFIPMHEGDTFTRDFEIVRIRNTSYPNMGSAAGYGVPARAIFVYSYGKTVERVFKPSGFVGGFPIVVGAGTETGADLFACLPATAGDAFPIGNPMRWGGTIAIKNIGSDRLYLYWGTPGQFDYTNGVASQWKPSSTWPIEAGETLSIDADSAMRFSNGSPAVAGSTVTTLCVGAVVASAPYALMLSRPALDVSDYESDAYPYAKLDFGGA